LETAPHTTRFPRRASLWPLATAGLLASGWATFLLAAGYASRLVERYGPAPDVVDYRKVDPNAEGAEKG
jgi:hypothetical protein